jgi:membrane fusion protein (multidrug efflux system)
VLLTGIAVGLAAGGYFSIPYLETMLNTVSTDDAYINGHVTLVPRGSQAW